MKLPIDPTVVFLPLALWFARVIGDGDVKPSAKLNGQFINNHKAQLISFDSKGGEIEVSVSIFVVIYII